MVHFNHKYFRPVADQLKNGESVKAEAFASVTIFFSGMYIIYITSIYQYFNIEIPTFDIRL